MQYVRMRYIWVIGELTKNPPLICEGPDRLSLVPQSLDYCHNHWLSPIHCVRKSIRTNSNTCSTTIPAKSLKISFRSEMDCTICRISRSRSSTMRVFCSTSISWSSVKPWNERKISRWSIVTPNETTPVATALVYTSHDWIRFIFMAKCKRKTSNAT